MEMTLLGTIHTKPSKQEEGGNKIELGEPVDVMVMMNFVEMMKQDWEQSIHFEDKVGHVYYGVNLQAGDELGSCYISVVIYYCFGRYCYDRKQITYVGKRNLL